MAPNRLTKMQVKNLYFLNTFVGVWMYLSLSVNMTLCNESQQYIKIWSRIILNHWQNKQRKLIIKSNIKV